MQIVSTPALAENRARAGNEGRLSHTVHLHDCIRGRRILLAHDYPLLREAIRTIVERDGYQVTGEVGTAAQALDYCRDFAPDIVLFDLEMPFVDGYSVVREITRVCPAARVVVMTNRGSLENVTDALWSGVRGYLLKTGDAAQLLHAVHQISRGGFYYCPEVSDYVGEQYPRIAQRDRTQLTDRERQVIKLVADGHSTKQVAAELGISAKTADSHRTKIMEKLNIHETASLVRFAVRQGIVEP